LEGLEIVEVGTGWFPMLPLLFSVSGVKRIHTYDKTRHLNADLTFRGLQLLKPHLGKVSAWVGRPQQEMEQRVDLLLGTAPNIDALLEAARISYHAPGDATTTGLPAASVDLIFSNSVLEHVPKPVMKLLFAESARILRPTGIAVHGVNCGDHYAYFDRSITQINFLQFSERAWSVWNNDLLYQNRMRPPDFKDLLAAEKLDLVFERRHARPGCAEAFQKMQVAPEFARYSKEDLVCTSFDFVARRKTA
jgi:SAM-dependent methyltransferase